MPQSDYPILEVEKARAWKRFDHPLLKDLQQICKNTMEKNTNSVISWFKQLQDKNGLSFVNLDAESFYLSISENLFQEAIKFARIQQIYQIQNFQHLCKQERHFVSMMIYHRLNVQEVRNSMYQWVHTMTQRAVDQQRILFRII